jgi:hypothetical protein
LAIENGDWMMDKSKTPQHKVRQRRDLQLCRGVLDLSIIQGPFCVAPCQTLGYHDSLKLVHRCTWAAAASASRRRRVGARQTPAAAAAAAAASYCDEKVANRERRDLALRDKKMAIE